MPEAAPNHRPLFDSQKYYHFLEPSIPGEMGQGSVTAVGGREEEVAPRNLEASQ